MNIACVLRESPEFGPEHVVWLQRQCEKFIPHQSFMCYTDSPAIAGIDCFKLQTDWPMWWSKMEIYGSDFQRGPVLILDLDTVILNKFEPSPEQQERSWVMRHFTHDGFRAPEEFACGIMLTTEEFRKKVFKHFTEQPKYHMGMARGDDQRYFWKWWRKDLDRFQDEFPDAFISYKLHVLQHGLNDDAVFVNFHGRPRPWELSLPWIPKLESIPPWLRN